MTVELDVRPAQSMMVRWDPAGKRGPVPLPDERELDPRGIEPAALSGALYGVRLDRSRENQQVIIRRAFGRFPQMDSTPCAVAASIAVLIGVGRRDIAEHDVGDGWEIAETQVAALPDD